MIVKLLAKYFKGAEYHNAADCPLARAIKHTVALESDKIDVGIYKSYINRVPYFHNGYTPEDYSHDQQIARSANFDDTVIREIELGKY